MDPELSRSLLRVAPFVVALIILNVLIRRGKLSTHAIGLRPPMSIVVSAVWLTGFLVFVLATEFLLDRLDLLAVPAWQYAPLPGAVRLIGIVFLAPITEEMIFRGVMLSRFAQRFGFTSANLLQALLFVIAHSFAYEVSTAATIGIFQTLLDAVLFGIARQRTDSLFIPIGMHMTGNIIAVLERFLF